MGATLAGCAAAVPETEYRMTSDPEGAEIYMGSSPEALEYYLTTPFETRIGYSLEWSGKYFQARKDGYEDSEVHLQPTIAMGTATTIHFDLVPDVSRADLEPYRERDTLEGYYEFLDRYPDAPFADEVFALMAERIAEQPDAADQYRELVAAYPEAMPLVLERQITDLESRDGDSRDRVEIDGSGGPEAPAAAEPRMDATPDQATGDVGGEPDAVAPDRMTEEAAVETRVAADGEDVSRSSTGAEMADADRDRIERTLAQQSEEMSRMADEFDRLRARHDALRDELESRYRITPGFANSVDDDIAAAAIPYCFQQYGRRAWESDPWRMEERCENELQQQARPTLEEYRQVEDTIDSEDRRYGSILEEHRALQESYERWQNTGEMDETLASFLASPETPTGGGESGLAAGGEPDFAAGGGECARKDRLFDQMGAQVTAAIRGSNDECDHQLANFLLHLFAYDLARVCHEAGMPDYSAQQVAELRQSIQGMSAHMDQVERRIGCRFDPALLRARDEWGHVPY